MNWFFGTNGGIHPIHYHVAIQITGHKDIVSRFIRTLSHPNKNNQALSFSFFQTVPFEDYLSKPKTTKKETSDPSNSNNNNTNSNTNSNPSNSTDQSSQNSSANANDAPAQSDTNTQNNVSQDTQNNDKNLTNSNTTSNNNSNHPTDNSQNNTTNANDAPAQSDSNNQNNVSQDSSNETRFLLDECLVWGTKDPQDEDNQVKIISENEVLIHTKTYQHLPFQWATTCVANLMKDYRESMRRKHQFRVLLAAREDSDSPFFKENLPKDMFMEICYQADVLSKPGRPILIEERPRCKWGPECIRRNEIHFEEYRHPWKEELIVTDVDELCHPSCIHENCYRANPEHFKKYRHDKNPKKRKVETVDIAQTLKVTIAWTSNSNLFGKFTATPLSEEASTSHWPSPPINLPSKCFSHIPIDSEAFQFVNQWGLKRCTEKLEKSD